MAPIEKNHDGGLYVGFIGIGYALLHISNSSLLVNKKEQFLNQAKYYIEQDLRFYSQKKKFKNDIHGSFLLGHVGTLCLSIDVYSVIFYLFISIIIIPK